MSSVPNETSRSGGLRMQGTMAQGTAERPLVTVITAVFNGEEFLASCLDSVIAQDYPTIEHVVIDGGSRDNTVAILEQYNDRIAFWKSEPDKGIYDAWNKGIAEARGEWICFLGADDMLLPGAVSAYMDLAAAHPEAEYLSSQLRWVHDSGYVRIVGKPWSWPSFSERMWVAHPGSMHRRSLFARLGTYDLSYRIVADYEILLRARDTLKAAFMPVLTVYMRAGGVSDGKAALAEAARAKRIAGGRNPLLVAFELQVARIKVPLRPVRRFFEGAWHSLRGRSL